MDAVGLLIHDNPDGSWKVHRECALPSPAGTAKAAEQLRGERDHVTARAFFWPSLNVGAKLHDGISKTRGSDQDNTRRDKRWIWKEEKSHGASNLLLSPWERFSSVFLQDFFCAVPRSSQPHTSPRPSAWLGSAEYWGINFTSENASAGVERKLAQGKSKFSFAAIPFGAVPPFLISQQRVCPLHMQARLERGNAQFPASAIPPLDTPFLTLGYSVSSLSSLQIDVIPLRWFPRMAPIWKQCQDKTVLARAVVMT